MSEADIRTRYLLITRHVNVGPNLLIRHTLRRRFNWLHTCFNKNHMIDEIKEVKIGGSRSTQGIDRELM